MFVFSLLCCCVFCGSLLVGYRYSERGALVVRHLAGGDGELSSAIILLEITYVVDYVL